MLEVYFSIVDILEDWATVSLILGTLHVLNALVLKFLAC